MTTLAGSGALAETRWKPTREAVLGRRPQWLAASLI
jgi:hypothetical protein